MLGATILSQSLWMIGGAVAVFIVLWLFFTRTLIGRAVLATSNNRLAARLVGINTRFIMTCRSRCRRPSAPWPAC
nr:hypothetical protein [Bordetella parapertussis]